ncbi:hypothetical protein JL100_004895 [Skermanella mucosa]|uniref:hypothetical protein n=1 Tax=Skermanella mucosa TaxID=1789672 RepID=UPI00192CAF8E|nr:hypothetical protein [Skermanella mucosa]UEM22099.1 hypothetical protein JL100_004895 [Skermanella mucosa]
MLDIPVTAEEATQPAAQMQRATSDSDPAQRDLKAGAPGTADPAAKADPARGRRGGKPDFLRLNVPGPGGNSLRRTSRRTAGLFVTTSLSAAWDVPPILPPTVRAA